MATVSLCMIVRNEEKVLTRCLDSVRGIADEICITDTGSTDKGDRCTIWHCAGVSVVR